MKGIVNSNNNCFINSLVQVLAYLDDFAEHLLDCKLNPDSHFHLTSLNRPRGRKTKRTAGSQDVCIVCTLTETLHSLRQHNEDSLQSEDLINLCKALDPAYKKGQTADPKLMYMLLIQAGKESCQIIHPEVEVFQSERTFSTPWDIFEGQIVQTVSCSNCQLQNETVTNSSIMHIPFECSVQKSFDLYFQEENVGYNCARCSHTEAILSKKLQHSPDVLVAEMQMYILDGQGCPIQGGASYDLPIKLPQTLRVKEMRYKLHGAVCHQGSTDKTRHYYALIVQHGTCILINDMDISLPLNQTAKVPAVLLFYEKQQKGTKGYQQGKSKSSVGQDSVIDDDLVTRATDSAKTTPDSSARGDVQATTKGHQSRTSNSSVPCRVIDDELVIADSPKATPASSARHDVQATTTGHQSRTSKSSVGQDCVSDDDLVTRATDSPKATPASSTGDNVQPTMKGHQSRTSKSSVGQDCVSDDDLVTRATDSPKATPASSARDNVQPTTKGHQSRTSKSSVGQDCVSDDDLMTKATDSVKPTAASSTRDNIQQTMKGHESRTSRGSVGQDCVSDDDLVTRATDSPKATPASSARDNVQPTTKGHQSRTSKSSVGQDCVSDDDLMTKATDSVKPTAASSTRDNIQQTMKGHESRTSRGSVGQDCVSDDDLVTRATDSPKASPASSARDNVQQTTKRHQSRTSKSSVGQDCVSDDDLVTRATDSAKATHVSSARDNVQSITKRHQSRTGNSSADQDCVIDDDFATMATDSAKATPVSSARHGVQATTTGHQSRTSDSSVGQDCVSDDDLLTSASANHFGPKESATASVLDEPGPNIKADGEAAANTSFVQRSIISTNEGQQLLEKCIALKKCVLCYNSKVMYGKKLTEHVEHVHIKPCISHNNQLALLCKLHCLGNDKTHYHCWHCEKTFRKKYQLINHHRNIDKSSRAIAKVASLKEVSQKTCGVCNKIMQAKHIKKHLQGHEKSKTSFQHNAGICIDQNNGIYIIAKSRKGNQYPLHVIRKVSDVEQKMECEDEDCRICMAMACRSNDKTKQCHHISSCLLAPYQQAKTLEVHYLDQLIHKNRISAERKTPIMELNEHAERVGQPTVSSWFPNGESATFYLSVFTGKTESYSRIGRVIILVSPQHDAWTCACEKHKKRRGCLHKAVAKWYLLQHHPNCLTTSVEGDTDDGRIEIPSITPLPDFSLDETCPAPEDKVQDQALQMTEYIHKYKRIPLDFQDDVNDISKIQMVMPAEMNCPKCARQFTRSNLTLATSSGMIVCYKYIVKNIKVYHKRCPCGFVVRHQEYSSGIFNYNDNLFLSIALCIFLRNSLQSNTAIGRVMNIIENSNGWTLPVNDIRCAYVMFECLADQPEIAETCVECSYYPPCLVLDNNQKIAFQLDETSLKHEFDNSNGQEAENEGAVEIQSFWDRLEKSCIYKGIRQCRDDQNPFYTRQSYTAWSPWVSRKSRKGALASNTEFDKIKKPGVLSTCDAELPEDFTEDYLLILRRIGNKQDLLDIAISCGFNVNNSFTKHRIIGMLEDHIKKGHGCDKLFEKVVRKSGGVTLACCPHGITYSMKWLLAYESPRDFVDILNSLAYPPTITICDIPRRLVTHAAKRHGEAYFFPHNGMATAESPHTLALAGDRQLKVEMPFIKNGTFGVSDNSALDHQYTSKGLHPITHTSHRYALYDRLHECNSTSEIDRLLRSVKVIPELRGIVNTQIVEQKNAILGKDAYFLDVMGHTHHLLVSRSIAMVQNFTINSKLVNKVKSFMQTEVSLDVHGRLEATASMDGKPLEKKVTEVATDRKRPTEFIDAKYDIPLRKRLKKSADIIGIKAEHVDDVSYERPHVHMLAVQTAPEYIFPLNSYSKRLKQLNLSFVDNDLWEKASLSPEVIWKLAEENGRGLTPNFSPFYLNEESLGRAVDQTAYINGEFIDSVLLTLGGLLSDGNLSFCVLPNQFLTLATDDITTWLPVCVTTGGADALVMAAHHTKHWCSVIIDIKNTTVLYCDPYPPVTTEESRNKHLHILNKVCNQINRHHPWKIIHDHDSVSDYFNIRHLPLQVTSTDCGTLAILYAWMAMCKMRNDNDWSCLDTTSTHLESMVKLRLLFAYLVLRFSDDILVNHCAERSDTGRWVGLKLFPGEKRNNRIEKRLLSSHNFTENQRTIYLRNLFPDTVKMIDLIRNKNIEGLTLPSVLHLTDSEFKAFVKRINDKDSEDWQEDLMFLCHNRTAMDVICDIMDKKKLRINFTLLNAHV